MSHSVSVTLLISFFFNFRDDYLRASRALLREIVRALRHDIDFVALCRGFMKERTESQFRDLDASLKVCYFVHCTVCAALSFSFNKLL